MFYTPRNNKIDADEVVKKIRKTYIVFEDKELYIIN